MTAITAAFSIPASTAQRGFSALTGSAAATAPAGVSSGGAEPTAADEALEALRGFEEEAAATRKEIARQKLERARENMTILRQFGLSSDFVARRAAEIGKDLSAAASDFAAAMGSAPPAVEAPMPAPSGDTTDTAAVTPLPSAYREILETMPSSAALSAALSGEDSETIDQFRSALFEVQAVLDWSLDDARREDDDPVRDLTGRRVLAGIDGAVQALARVDGP
ncbi:hypothetical protein LXM94_18260 [Rhizobium sp. TRM95111]|uniref:hypothetical protein n=1 Tax=Rhizobium alarense TaxID=2846851 RepID=UPI001F1B90EA|nr:hypothetical protein [Rhizobium alarense]MCF3641915.1 hypothetical protein [Rhizobium alarense]